jgi:Tfp pilus assembly protein PilO
MPGTIKSSDRFNRLFIKFFWLIILVIVLAVLAAGWFLLLGSQVSTLLEMPKTLQALSVQEQLLEQKKAALDELAQAPPLLSPVEEKLLDLILPSELDFPSIAEHFLALGRSNNFTISSVDVSPSADNGSDLGSGNSHLKSATINLGISIGSYGEFRRFLQLLENSVMVANIYSVSFPLSGASIVTYYYQ